MRFWWASLHCHLLSSIHHIISNIIVLFSHSDMISWWRRSSFEAVQANVVVFPWRARGWNGLSSWQKVEKMVRVLVIAGWFDFENMTTGSWSLRAMKIIKKQKNQQDESYKKESRRSSVETHEHEQKDTERWWLLDSGVICEKKGGEWLSWKKIEKWIEGKKKERGKFINLSGWV